MKENNQHGLKQKQTRLGRPRDVLLLVYENPRELLGIFFSQISSIVQRFKGMQQPLFRN